MADYRKHIGFGSFTGIVYGSVCYFVYGINLIQAVAIATVAEIGSILPDIDSDTSKPRQIVLGILGITIPTILACNYVKTNSLESTFCLVLFSYLIIQHILPLIFAKYTCHRGLFHSIQMGILFSEWIYILFSESGKKVALIYATACFVGYLSHLILDELSSIKINELNAKRSFGAALKFTGPSKFRTILLYFFIFCSAVGCILV